MDLWSYRGGYGRGGAVSLYWYTGGVLFHVEWCISQLWSSSTISFNITSIANNRYTNIYPQTYKRIFILVSYTGDEDALVTDANLAEHLSKWGIDIMRLEKTDKTMGELEVDLNMKYDWQRILGAGKYRGEERILGSGV